MTRPRLEATLRGAVGACTIDVTLATTDRPLAIVGPNGAGKSSLLAMILGAHAGVRGRIAIGDRLLLDSEAARSVPIEDRRLGYVPQEGALFPHRDVRGNLALAAELARVPEGGARVERALAELELASLASRAIDALSGGERQRVALARALVTDPIALLLDEPLSALDAAARRDVLALMRDVLARTPIPAIVVTHDVEDVRALGADVVVLEGGRVVQEGTLDAITRAPATSFVEAFVARTIAR